MYSTLTQVDILGDVSAAAAGVPPTEVRYKCILSHRLTYWVMCQQLPEECLPQRFVTNVCSTLTQVGILRDVPAAAGEEPP
jgi:hypothetical protein